MTKAQLFREVWLELHPGQDDEDSFRLADTVVPDTINDEIPDHLVDPMRRYCLELARKIDAQSDEVNYKYLRKHNSAN